MTLLHTHIDHLSFVCTLLDRLVSAAPTEDGRPETIISLDGDDSTIDLTLVVLKLLESLGAVKIDLSRLSVQVPSVQAGYLLRLLSDVIDCGEPLVADWTREGVTPPQKRRHPFARGVDLLAALESRRLEVLPGAAPIREVSSAVGLIMHDEPTDTRSFLLAYDDNANAWQLPGGRFEQRDSTFRATLLRELSEELHCHVLHEPRDVTLSPLGASFSITRMSPTYGLLTRTSFQAYLVRFARGLPQIHSGLRWVSEDEVVAKQTLDQQKISAEPLIHLLSDARITL